MKASILSIIFFGLFILGWQNPATANDFSKSYFCKNELESLPILQGGRIKPLFVHANESIKQLTGKTKVGQYSATEAYCLLSTEGLGIPSEINLLARIDHVDVQKLLNLKNDVHEISYKELLHFEELLRIEIQKQKVDSSYKKSLVALFNGIFLYKEIKNGENWQLAEPNPESATESQKIQNDNRHHGVLWVPLVVYLTEQKIIEQKNKEPGIDPFLPVLMQSKKTYIDANGEKFLMELTYVKAHLPEIALFLSLLGLALLVLVKNPLVAISMAGLTVVIQTAILAFRIMISGRAPITNMYETVLFSGHGALVLAMAIGHFKKQTLYIYMGLAYNVCALMMLNFAGGMLSASISPLVPVLRDNFWLATHVTTIILSYGALALSWILANTALVKRKLGKFTVKDDLVYADVIYTTLKWGTTLLAAGIILGGVWADYSWGRFWGWDPKETWSLIVLCFYMAILHGRYTSWIKPDRFITVTALAFMSVMMAWFGVNYILASGLHSYGFSQGGAFFLATFFTLQILLVLFTYKSKSLATVPGTL